MDLDDEVQSGFRAGHHRHLGLVRGGALDQPVQTLVCPVIVPVLVLREAATATAQGRDVAHGLRPGFASLRQLLDEGHLVVEGVQEGLTFRPRGLEPPRPFRDQALTLRAVHVEQLEAGAAHSHHSRESELAAHLRPAHPVGQAQVDFLGGLALDPRHVRHHLVVVGVRVVAVLVPGFNCGQPGLVPNQVLRQAGVVDRHARLLLAVVVGRPQLPLLRQVDRPPHHGELVPSRLLLEVRVFAGQSPVGSARGPVAFVILLAAELVERPVKATVHHVVLDGLGKGRAQLVHLPGTFEEVRHRVVD